METQLCGSPRRCILYHGIRPACGDPFERIRLGRLVLEGQQASAVVLGIAPLDVSSLGYIWTSTKHARQQSKSPRCRTRFSQNSKIAIKNRAKIKTMRREARRTSWFPTPITLQSFLMMQSPGKKEMKSSTTGTVLRNDYDYRVTPVFASSATTMRYYEQRYPEVDELVMVQVRQIAEMGAYVKLVSLASTNTDGRLIHSAARIRQYRRHDPTFGAFETTHTIHPKTDPSGQKRSRRRTEGGPRKRYVDRACTQPRLHFS